MFLEPNTLLVERYPGDLMPPIAAILTESLIAHLVEYLVKVPAGK